MLKRFFDIDFARLVIFLTPPLLRSRKMIYWMQCNVVPLAIIHSIFTNNRAANLYNLAHNGQVCFLRKALNDGFDQNLRRIYISDGNEYNRQYIYTNAEQQPKYLGTMYLRNADDYADTGIDFRVIVPFGFDLNGNYHQLKAMIDFYKLASKRYKIQFENE